MTATTETQNGRMVTLWRGENVESLTREQLIEAVKDAARLLHEQRETAQRDRGFYAAMATAPRPRWPWSPHQ